ncbi:hypothetical protein MAM1_0110c05535 [Mucor ambiguus]|uniref:Transmembrane protein n=1 Tax=Mucor ambiguus TaxID=91626 RepID=A0A0C9MVA7_9FUNG|nr:hypothetical protein MAM1_0110c05535 [Mucor ambiguus]
MATGGAHKASKDEIKFELVNYKPSKEEELVIRSAVFNFITLGMLLCGLHSVSYVVTNTHHTATIGAASLGMSARLWDQGQLHSGQQLLYQQSVRKQPTRHNQTTHSSLIHSLVGTFAGLTCGGVLGMDKGMHKLRESLPRDSHLLKIIHENDQLKQQAQETLFGGPIRSSTEDQQDTSLFNDDAVQQLQDDTTTSTQLEMIEDQLAMDDASPSTKQLE